MRAVAAAAAGELARASSSSRLATSDGELVKSPKNALIRGSMRGSSVILLIGCSWVWSGLGPIDI